MRIAEYQEEHARRSSGEAEPYESYVYTDKWRGYDVLVFAGYKHKRVNHSQRYSNRTGTHINGVENFRGFAKQRLAKFHGISGHTFYLHLKNVSSAITTEVLY